MQDCSGSWSSPDGRFHIAVTADGHGDRLCARSDRGASFAVKAAMDALRSFADTYSGNIQEISERLSLERRSDLTGLYPSPLMTHLARCIVSGWRRMVLEDAGRSPLSMWEKLIRCSQAVKAADPASAAPSAKFPGIRGAAATSRPRCAALTRRPASGGALRISAEGVSSRYFWEATG